MFDDEIKKLIIVCDEKDKIYANYLSQLIGAKSGEKIEDNKERNAEATIWTEKIYIANEPEMSSNTNVVFIGETKSARNITPNIVERYNRYGIHCGWLGNRAVVYVEKRILGKFERDDFIIRCKDMQNEFTDNAKTSNSTDEILFLDALKWALLPLPVLFPFKMYDFASRSISDKKIKEQQYKVAIFIFYMNYLSEFLEG